MYWLILLVPFLIALLVKVVLHQTITWKEMGVQIGVSVAITAIVLACGLYSQTADTEIWNGEITAKKKLRVSCEHSYSCNCVTVSCGKNCTTQVCQTCYDHDYDIDWRVYNNIDSEFNIQRVDRQGLKEPQRWNIIQAGEPYASEHTFTNYIKAVPESIFSEQVDPNDPLRKLVPTYPRVHDYYRVKRVLSAGVPVQKINVWNNELNEYTKKLGPRKRVNPIIIFAKTNDPKYEYVLQREWLNGKKNDMVVVFGVSQYPHIDFVRIVGWENEEIKLRLKNELETFDTIDDNYRTFALGAINEYTIKYFKKMQMEDYEYLKDQIEPPTWVIIFGFILSIAVSCGLTYWFHKEDVFGDERKSYGGYSGARMMRPRRFR